MDVVEHGHAPEEVMAYVDGELSTERGAAVEAHLAECGDCRELMQELRELSRRMSTWEVEPPLFTLRGRGATEPGRTFWRVLWPQRLAAWHFVAAPAVVAIALVSFGGKVRAPWSVARSSAVAQEKAESYEPAVQGAADALRGRTPRAQGQAGAQGQQGQAAIGADAKQREQRLTSKPQIARTATLRMMAAEFDSVRSAVERIVADAGGFVGRLELSGERGDTRSLRATVRVPSDRLGQVLAALRQLGKVQAESQGADDVTEQVVDLNARLTNARNTERRLTLVLEQRTGKVGDVLQVEREIARVREEIERMDAERTTLERRVTYAIVALEIVEPRKAALDLGPITVPDRLRNAAVEGLQQASESALRAALVVIWMLPSLLIWGAMVAWPAVVIIRRVRSSRRHSTA